MAVDTSATEAALAELIRRVDQAGEDAVDDGGIREIGGPMPGRRTVMNRTYLRWYYHGRPVFKRKVHQKGARYMLKAREPVEATFRDVLADHLAKAIRSVSVP